MMSRQRRGLLVHGLERGPRSCETPELARVKRRCDARDPIEVEDAD